MRTERGTLAGNQVVFDQFIVMGSVEGNATVIAGGELVLEGMVMGDLVIEAGGSATVHGTVVGDVVNAGTIAVFGRVRGRLHTVGEGSTTVDRGATVDGGPAD